MESNTKAYRPEIDGIRAIAVLAVMLFHAGAPGVRGGFLGVDVFFVISGFLITAQIESGIQVGTFTYQGFYMRRIRRIIPALVAASALTFPLAIWLMLPDDLENYGESLVATGLSANNILLFWTSDYFALETLYKPLVHTWSLGVEEQYYLLVPLLMALAIRISGRLGSFAILALTATASFLFAMWLGHASPNANFYLLPSRFWELGLGGIAAMAQSRLCRYAGIGSRRILAAIGLVMIVGSMALIGESSLLPSWPSLLPTIGAALVLIYSDTGGVGRILGSPSMRGIGLISYSAYLYHQPVFAYVRLASLNEPTWPTMAITFPLVLALGWISWRFVERPFRDPASCSTRSVLLFSIGGTLLSIAAGLLLYLTSGFHARWAELSEGDPLFGARQNAAYVDGPYSLDRKPFGNPDRRRNILVVGNSFARDFINMGRETGKFDHYAISYVAGDYCRGKPWAPEVFALAKQAGAVVFASGVGKEDPHCVLAAVHRVEQLGVAHVVVLSIKNFGFNNNAIMHLPDDVRHQWRVRPLAEIRAMNARARTIIPERYYVDLLSLLDDKSHSGTVPVFTPEHKFISQDRKHLTSAGAGFLGAKVFAQPQFKWLN
jgi:peptidoglycan/LPS O-acetylase OafA/YrhL